jgi:hypothetical protein
MSKTTDEMVMDLLQRGFTLPDGLIYHQSVSMDRRGMRPVWQLTGVAISDRYAHPLIAMHFAAEQSSMGDDEFEFTDWQWDEFQNCMGLGLADDAIKLLWEAGNE